MKKVVKEGGGGGWIPKQQKHKRTVSELHNESQRRVLRIVSQVLNRDQVMTIHVLWNNNNERSQNQINKKKKKDGHDGQSQ